MKTCPQCHTPLDVDAPEGLCPRCLAAAVCTAVLLGAHQFRPASVPARAAMPELFFPALAACTGGLAWTWIFKDVTGWNFWHGAAFATLNFVLALFLLITSGAVKIAVHRLRERYRVAIREEIAETVDGAAEIEEELRHLLKVLSH